MYLRLSLFSAATLVQFMDSAAGLPPNEDTLAARQAPQPPSQDPFYTPPSDFSSAAGGAILKSRKLAGTNYPNAPIAAAYQLLYRTNNAQMTPSSAVTTVLIPPEADFSKVLSYQAAYDESFIDCSPSYAFYPGSDSAKKDSIGGDVSGAISKALNRGYIVSVPDYEVDAAWTDGLGSGRSVSDSILAVVASGAVGTGVDPEAKAILYGYSGGSQATEWATEVLAAYAPKANVVAAALGGLPVNVTTTNLALNEQGAAGYIPTSFVGLAKAYPTFNEALNADLKPEQADSFRIPLTTCSNTWAATFANQDVFGTYLKSGTAFLDQVGPKTAIQKGAVMGQRGPPKGFPLYIFKGTADEIVPTIEETDDLVNGYCAAGSKITYVRYQGGSHGGTQAAGQADALTFAFHVLDSGSGPSACSTKTVPV